MSQPYDPYQVPDETRQSRRPGGAPGTGRPHDATGYEKHPFNPGDTRQYGTYAGQQRPAYPHGYIPSAPPPQDLPQGFAIAALVLGITGLVVSWFTFGIPSILAVIFGHVGFSRAGRGTAGGKGMAIAGLALGYTVIGLFVLFVAVFVAYA